MRTYELSDLSDILSELQWGLRRHFGIREVYIGGGSSRAILDHVYYGEPIFMRDFDIFAVRHSPVDSEYAERIGKQLESPTLGDFSRADLRPRQRIAPYVAGWGFFWKRFDLEIDLSLFHSFSDLNLNGLLDIDTVMIPLRFSTSLVQASSQLSQGEHRRGTRNSNLVYDRFNGYAAFREKEGRIIRWEAVASDPIQIAIRIVRAFGKMQRDCLSPSIREGLTEAIKHQRGFDRLQGIRNLLKLLGDPKAALELKMLQEVGLFKVWLRGLDILIAELPAKGISLLLECVRCSQDVNSARLLKLADFVGASSRAEILLELALVQTSGRKSEGATLPIFAYLG